MNIIPKPHVTIILLNLNRWEDSIECVESILMNNYPNWDVLLVDNGSQDESISKFKSWSRGEILSQHSPMLPGKPSQSVKKIEHLLYNAKKSEFEYLDRNPISDSTDYNIKLLEMRSNYGFTGGNNIAIQYALQNLNTDYILLLNNDAVIDPDYLDEMISIGEQDDEIGVLGPFVYYYYEPQKIQTAGVDIVWKKCELNIHHLNEIDSGIDPGLTEIDFVSGCALLAKKEVFQNIGSLKEEYFAYWEDTEWCLRAKKAGYKVVCSSKAKVWHKEFATNNKISGYVEYYSTRNMFWLMKEGFASKSDVNYFYLYFIFYQFLALGFYYIRRSHNIRALTPYLKGVKDGLFGYGKTYKNKVI